MNIPEPPEREGICAPARSVQSVLGSLAGAILLLVLTCGSVSMYQVSGLLPGILVILVVLASIAIIAIAAGCRHRARALP